MFEQTNRPRLKLKLSSFEILLEIISMSIVIGTFIYLAVRWDTMPDKIPAHFGITGEVDRWGSKSSLLSVAIITGVFYIMFTFLSRFPHIFNYLYNITERNAELQYRNARLMLNCIKVEAISYFVYTIYRAIAVSIKGTGGLGTTPLLIFLLIIFITLVYFLISTIRIEEKLKY